MEEALSGFEYYTFSYPSDSLYNQLANTEDSVLLDLVIENLFSMAIVLNNHSIASAPYERISQSFSKAGIVSNEDHSKVYCHFSNDYFWITIQIDSMQIQILPLRAVSEQFYLMLNTYVVVIKNSEMVEAEDVACDNIYIEASIIVDQTLYEKLESDMEWIKMKIEYHILEINNHLNQYFNPVNGDLKLSILTLDIWDQGSLITNEDLDNLNEDLINYRFVGYMESRWPCYDPDVHLYFTGMPIGVEGTAQVSTLCEIDLNAPYPGIAIVNMSNANKANFTAGNPNRYTTNIAHELYHVIGANHLENTSCAIRCEEIECPLMCTLPCGNFKMDACTIDDIKDKFENLCEGCLSELTDLNEVCDHCEVTTNIIFSNTELLIADCETRRQFTATFEYINDCIVDQNFMFSITIDKFQLDIIDLGDFTSVTEFTDNLRLNAATVSTTNPEEIFRFQATFSLKDDVPMNMTGASITPVPFRIFVNGFDVPQTDYATYETYFIKPRVVDITIEDAYLSDYINNNPIGEELGFHTDNQTSCTKNTPPFKVANNFIVDIDYCFNNGYIILGPGAKIIIEDGVTCTINKDRILGCEEMWESIEVLEGGTLIIENSSIEDAMKAVDLEENTELSSTSTRYHNNNIAIRSVLEEAGDIDFQLPGGNVITSDGQLPREPFLGEMAKAGIWLENVNNVSIEGEPPHDSPGMNVIGKLNNGIVLINSNASISNFHMYDLKKIGDPYLVDDELPNGHGIYINGTASGDPILIGSADTRDNYINGSHTGIFAKNAEVNVEYVNIYNNMLGVILGYNPRGESSITNSLIDATFRGIQLRLPTSLDVSITNNRITTKGMYSIGIESLSSWGSVSISDNLFFLNQSHSGISLLDCQGSDVINNTLVFNTISAGSMKGINLESSFDCRVVDNTIFGKDQSGYTVGIYVQDSPNNLIQCNSSNMVNIGNQYTGINSMTRYLANELRESEYGLLLGSEAIGSDALVGEQIQKENKWNFQNYGIKGAWNMTEDPFAISQSRFIVDDSQTSYFPPNIGELISVGWFVDIAHDPYDFDCQNPPIEDVCCDNFSIPDSVIGFATNAALKNFHLHRQLYNSIQFDILDTTGNAELNQYFSKLDTTDHGKLSKVRWNFYKAVTEEPEERANFIDDALTFNAAVTGIADFIEYETNTNDLLAQYLVEGNLTLLIEEEVAIREIAELCPYQNGSGVYMSRSLLKALDIEVGFDELDECGEIEPRSSNGENSPDIKLSYYPNPVTVGSPVTFLLIPAVTSLIVFDLLGNQVQLEKLKLDTHTTSFVFRYPGVYIAVIMQEDGLFETSKIVVID